ncbi:spore germination protein [Scopulibacillus cellulosilyticus]|uniref:Spore germination protein n=1 Tax=Scopulibacillus cellulosilyticus TaxID=2665665 RepID=A0ABW2PX14_9BACL
MSPSKSVDVNFEQLSINNIDSNSGIFIGNNHANGWSYSHKSNNGFGTISGQVKDAIQIIFDNDHVDMPVNERQYYFHEEPDDEPNTEDNNYSIFSEQNIAFDEVNVNSLSSNATVTMGNNRQNEWHAYSKTNSGLGRLVGENHAYQTSTKIIDNDFIDAPIQHKVQTKGLKPKNKTEEK